MLVMPLLGFMTCDTLLLTSLLFVKNDAQKWVSRCCGVDLNFESLEEPLDLKPVSDSKMGVDGLEVMWL